VYLDFIDALFIGIVLNHPLNLVVGKPDYEKETCMAPKI
jgi:hypothetical protein